ncbi:hypothetical protein L1049_023685 [Liquidambar formosana]|uniref:BHLH domain-containing protein n=1 Tax=Liquidambar formosana TaxID=63359 RepID=A0AAP0RTR8_LIQFO
MGDMYDNSCFSSSSSSPFHHLLPSSSSRPGGSAPQQDEFSLFLHQILGRSSSHSSPSSSSVMAHKGNQMNPHRPCRSALAYGSERLVQDGIGMAESSSSGADSSAGVVFSSSGPYFPVADVRGSAVNVCSSSAGATENDFDEYDCESEEGLEAFVEEAQTKHVPPRGSSKRSRAAEVHNLSEKRRRSRINEKMKALQNLIPNSNKTDKASMLDEAIEYLKQLQLQVQMLSMRNGLSLHPMCLPGVLQPIQPSQMRMGLGEGNDSLHMNMAGTLPVNQEMHTQTVFNLPNQCTTTNQPPLPNMSQMINSETSFGLESSIQAHLGSFQLHTSSEEICRDSMLPHQQLNVNHSEKSSLATVSLPFDTQASELKDRDSLEACIQGRDQSEVVLLKNIERNQILSPHLNGMHGIKSAPGDDVKIETLNF